MSDNFFRINKGILINTPTESMEINPSTGIIKSDGSVIQNDGYKNYIKNGNFEAGLTGWQLGTIADFNLPPVPGAADLEMLLDTTNPINGTASLIVQNKSTSPIWPANQGFFYHIGTITGQGTTQFSGCVDSFRWQLPDFSQIFNANWSGDFQTSTFRHYFYSTKLGYYIEALMYNSAGVLYYGYLPEPNGDQVNYLIGDNPLPIDDDIYYWIGAINPSTGPITLKFDDISLGSPPSDIVYQQTMQQVNALSNNIVLKTGGTMTGTLSINPGNIIANNTSIFPAVYGSEYSVKAQFNNNTFQPVNSGTYSSIGTATGQSYDSNSQIGKMPRIEFASLSSAGSICGPRLTGNDSVTIGSGFRFETYFQITDSVSKARHFCGLNTDETNPVPINSTANINPLEISLTNFIAVGADNLYDNYSLKIYHTAGVAGAGITTKIDLGPGFSTINNNIFKVTLVNPIGQNKVFYEVKNLTNNIRQYGEITTNLPTGPLYFHNERTNGGTAAQVKMQAGGLYSYSGS